MCVIGNLHALEAWRHDEFVPMSDDGRTFGDRVSNDHVFTFAFTASPKTTCFDYLFAHSTMAGEWGDGRPLYRRHAVIPSA